MGAFSNFAVSFTIISILSGCLTLFGFGMYTGGPASSAYGWPLVGILVTFVALAMAEICSSYPTAGGLYYWSAKVAPKNGPAWSWFTGWFNLLGQVAVTAGIDFGFAAFFCAFLHIAFSVEVTKLILIGSYTGVLAIHGVMNTFGIKLVAFLNDVSVWWHVAGVLVIFGLLFFVPDHHTTFGTIFSFNKTADPGEVAGFVNGTGFTSGFFGSTIYIFLIGLLMAQYTLTGYDASAHMTEETHDADISGTQGRLPLGRDLGDLRLHPPARRVARGAGRSGFQQGARLPAADLERRGPRADLPRCAGQEPGRLRAADRARRAVLLRDGLGHGELADDLRVLARRSDPRLEVLAQDQQADPHPHQLDLVRGGRSVALGGAGLLAGQRDRVLRRHRDRGDRALHRLRPADVPSAPGGRRLQAGSVEPREVEQAGRHDRRRVDGLHLHHADDAPVEPRAGSASRRSTP